MKKKRKVKPSIPYHRTWAGRHFWWIDLGNGAYLKPRLIHS
jgi:hypothetical protein